MTVLGIINFVGLNSTNHPNIGRGTLFAIHGYRFTYTDVEIIIMPENEDEKKTLSIRSTQSTSRLSPSPCSCGSSTRHGPRANTSISQPCSCPMFSEG